MQRRNDIHTSRLARLLMLLCVCIVMVMPGHAQRRKLVVACDWDFAPYEFINGDGHADGFNVELLSTILHRLDIPYEIMVKARSQCINAFLSRQADLIVDYRDRFVGPPYVRTVTPIGYYSLVVTHHQNSKPLTSIRQLKGKEGIVFNSSNDSISYEVLDTLADSIKDIHFQSPRSALSGIVSGEYKYFIWGEQPVKQKMKELNIENVVCTQLSDLPPTEIHIVGYDKHLIDEIASQYARMLQSGEIDRLHDKWFHPEEVEQRTSPLALYIILVALLLTISIVFIYRFMRVKLRKTVLKYREMETMMNQALSMDNYIVMIIDLRKRRVFNVYGHVLPDEGIDMVAMLDYIHPDDRQQILIRRDRKDSMHKQSMSFTIRWNTGTKENPHWIDITGFSYPEFDNNHHPVRVVIAAHDITDAKEMEQSSRNLGTHYLKMFESTLLAMSFYGKDGRLIDMNSKMKELCGITDDIVEDFQRTLLFDYPNLKGELEPGAPQNFHVCEHVTGLHSNVDVYVEMRVMSVTDNSGEVLYYIITARDITEERNMYRELSSQQKAIEEASRSNRIYERELHTLLVNCSMYVWNLDVSSDIIYLSRSLNEPEFHLTLNEYADIMTEDHRQQALVNIKQISALKQPFNFVHHFRHAPMTEGEAWFSISGMPLLDADGNVKGFFGIVRNVTKLMEAQEQLKEETARAENSAMLKSTFLANMTHEIRTPLNAIVGFSDLLQMVDAGDERKEFIRIIRNNCDMLMRLINDIFEASTMDIKPLEIVPKEVDFAAEFAVVCQSLAQRVQEPAVQFIVDSPRPHFVTRLDMGRMQQVITNFVTNAVKYTHEGHIRVGWSLERPASVATIANAGANTIGALGATGIYMYCEDTGTGIPKEKQKKVFDRFVKLNDYVQGTGLGLSICKSIAERSGGCIGVDSEGEGHGCTFWIWVPCHEI